MKDQSRISWSAWSGWLTGKEPLAEIHPLSKRIEQSLVRQAMFTEQLLAICDGIPASTEWKLIKCRHLEAQLLFLLRNKHRLGIDPETGELRE